MPKSKKKRKKKDKKQKTDNVIGEGDLSSHPVLEKKTLRERLYENNSEGLLSVVTLLPLFFGAWLAGGIVLKEIFSFILATAVIIIAHSRNKLRSDQAKGAYFGWVQIMMYGAVLLLTLVFAAHTQSFSLSAILVLSTILMVVLVELPQDRSTYILLKANCTWILMSLLGLLGLSTQLFNLGSGLVWDYLVFGLVPGTVAGAAVLLRGLDVFVAEGWRRGRTVETKKGEEKLRPEGLAQWYSLLLIAGPAVPLLAFPFGIFPKPFIACALAFYSIPKLAQDFLEENQTNSALVLRTTNLAAMLTLLMYLIGLAAKYLV